jgi:hypothetical protein
MLNTIVGAGAASRYGSSSGSDQKMRLLAAPAPQHWLGPYHHIRAGRSIRTRRPVDL